MQEVVVNYIKIIEAIKDQFDEIWEGLLENSDPNIVAEISNIKGIEVSDEQSFNKKKKESKVEKGKIHIVVKFGSGSINYGASVTPISLLCLGTANKVKPTQIILGVFASAWTTKALGQELDSEISNTIQVWNTPEIGTNFNEVDADFRNLFKLTGNIVIGQSAVRLGKLTYIYDESTYNPLTGAGFETVNIMSFQDGYRANPDPQPFGNTFGFTLSEVNFSVYTFSISTYLLDNHLSADMLAIRGFRNRNNGTISSNFQPNKKVRVKLEFSNGFTNFPSANESSSEDDPILGSDFFSWFKVMDSQIGQEIAGIPTLTITFTR